MCFAELRRQRCRRGNLGRLTEIKTDSKLRSSLDFETLNGAEGYFLQRTYLLRVLDSRSPSSSRLEERS
jgi:hypothetical protein